MSAAALPVQNDVRHLRAVLRLPHVPESCMWERWSGRQGGLDARGDSEINLLSEPNCSLRIEKVSL
jgi:hypothetical protein